MIQMYTQTIEMNGAMIFHSINMNLERFVDIFKLTLVDAIEVKRQFISTDF